MHQVNYATSHPLVANPPGSSGNTVPRPWASVRLHHGVSSWRVWSLVDTGADDSVMDVGVAAILGINPYLLPVVSVNTANGSGSFSQLTGMLIEVAGVQVKADVLFGSVSVPLLGRSALLGLFATGFDASQWHHA